MSKLEYRNVTFQQMIDNDAGSGAATSLTNWKPDLSDDWYHLGPAATNSDSVPSIGAIVKQLEQGVVKDVADWIQVWNDAGYGNKNNYALWRGVGPTPDYVVVGGFFTRIHDKPTADETKGVKAIHISALQTTAAGSEIWTDKKSGSKANGAIWGISTLGVVATGAFVPVKGYNNPPEEVYGLQPNQVSRTDEKVC